MVTIGEKVFENIMMGPRSGKELYPGTVVYIHPLNRFYTVEFDGKNGKVRESYIIERDTHGNPL